MEKASGVNLEAKSGAGVPEAVRVVLATPATSLKPVVLALAFPLDYFSDVERGHSSFVYSIKTLDAVPSPPYRARYHSLSRLKDAHENVF